MMLSITSAFCFPPHPKNSPKRFAVGKPCEVKSRRNQRKLMDRQGQAVGSVVHCIAVQEERKTNLPRRLPVKQVRCSGQPCPRNRAHRAGRQRELEWVRRAARRHWTSRRTTALACNWCNMQTGCNEHIKAILSGRSGRALMLAYLSRKNTRDQAAVLPLSKNPAGTNVCDARIVANTSTASPPPLQHMGDMRSVKEGTR